MPRETFLTRCDIHSCACTVYKGSASPYGGQEAPEGEGEEAGRPRGSAYAK